VGGSLQTDEPFDRQLEISLPNPTASVDMSLHGSLLIGYDLAVVRAGVLGSGSRLLMVKCGNGSEVDEPGWGLFEWRILDSAGWLVAEGEKLRNLEGGTRPVQWLQALADHLIQFAEGGVDSLNDELDALDTASDHRFEFENYLAALLPPLREQLAKIIDALDIVDQA
jgi:hypothetical protein